LLKIPLESSRGQDVVSSIYITTTVNTLIDNMSAGIELHRLREKLEVITDDDRLDDSALGIIGSSEIISVIARACIQTAEALRLNTQMMKILTDKLRHIQARELAEDPNQHIQLVKEDVSSLIEAQQYLKKTNDLAIYLDSTFKDMDSVAPYASAGFLYASEHGCNDDTVNDIYILAAENANGVIVNKKRVTENISKARIAAYEMAHEVSMMNEHTYATTQLLQATTTENDLATSLSESTKRLGQLADEHIRLLYDLKHSSFVALHSTRQTLNAMRDSVLALREKDTCENPSLKEQFTLGGWMEHVDHLTGRLTTPMFTTKLNAMRGLALALLTISVILFYRVLDRKEKEVDESMTHTKQLKEPEISETLYQTYCNLYE